MIIFLIHYDPAFPFLVSMALIFLHLTSCNPERGLANRFVKERQPMAILLLPPEFSFKYNYKIPDIENFDSLPKLTQDSLLFYNSNLLQYISDSLFISAYIKGMSLGLKTLGFIATYIRIIRKLC